MPRKRKATEEEKDDLERRTTRRSLRQAATPKKEEIIEQSIEKKLPARAKARGKKDNDTELASPARKSRGKSRASASPRKKKTKTASSDEEEDDDEGGEDQVLYARRSPRAAAATAASGDGDEPLSPRRRSSRGAAKAASEAIVRQASVEEKGEAQDETDESRGVKRKADDEGADESEPVTAAEKKQKVDEEGDAKEEGEAKVDAEDQPADINHTPPPVNGDVSAQAPTIVTENNEPSKESQSSDAVVGNKASESLSKMPAPAPTIEQKLEKLLEVKANVPCRKRADDECRMCRGVNLGKRLSCLGCDCCTHLDCLEAIARVQYMLRQVHYDRDVWLCAKCQSKPMDELVENAKQAEEAAEAAVEKEKGEDDVTDAGFVVVKKSEIPAHDSEQIQQSLPRADDVTKGDGVKPADASSDAGAKETSVTPAAEVENHQPEATASSAEDDTGDNAAADATDDTGAEDNEPMKDGVASGQKAQEADGSDARDVVTSPSTSTPAAAITDTEEAPAPAGDVAKAGDDVISGGDAAVAKLQSSPLKSIAAKDPATNGDVAGETPNGVAACVNGDGASSS